MEIVQERLEREFDLALITTAPTVAYRVSTTAGEALEIDNPAKLPPPGRSSTIEEPYIRASIHVPTEFIGAIYKLCQETRGEHKSRSSTSASACHLTYELPLAEIVIDFYDKLKSMSAATPRWTTSSSTSGRRSW